MGVCRGGDEWTDLPIQLNSDGELFTMVGLKVAPFISTCILSPGSSLSDVAGAMGVMELMYPFGEYVDIDVKSRNCGKKGLVCDCTFEE